MKRAGFTMIELIFVIVILGILAAVALPRLGATRDDAVISKMVANTATLVSDYGANYTARGDFNTSVQWSEITNVPLESAPGIFDTNGTINTSVYLSDGTTNCVSFKGVDDDEDGIYDKLTVSGSGTLNADNICGAVKNAIIDSKLEDTHEFGGSRVKY